MKKRLLFILLACTLTACGPGKMPEKEAEALYEQDKERKEEADAAYADACDRLEAKYGGPVPLEEGFLVTDAEGRTYPSNILGMYCWEDDAESVAASVGAVIAGFSRERGEYLLKFQEPFQTYEDLEAFCNQDWLEQWGYVAMACRTVELYNAEILGIQ